MSRPQSKPSGTSSKVGPGCKQWAALNWDNLEVWAGKRSVQRGKAYQRQGRVRDLAIAEDGRLLASVYGTERYITSAWLAPNKKRISDRLESECSCPIGASGCKHAVAVIAELLAAIAAERVVPIAKPDDRRWAALSDDPESDLDPLDDADDEDDAYDVDEARPVRKSRSSSSNEFNQRLHAYLQQKNRADLIALVETVVNRFPELREEFQDRLLLEQGDVARLISAARREVRTVTAEFGWRNQWTNEGHLPNYSHLKHKLERLIELGQADKVVDLGRDLIAGGLEQIGQSNDEGETAAEFSDCVQAVFDAVAKSNLAAPEKILYAIDACLQDDYDALGKGVGKLLDAKWSKSEWSIVADRLSERLLELPAGKKREDFTSKFNRDHLTSFLADALTRAGRSAELSAMYEAEARATGSYQRFVRYLIEQKKFKDAERWAREGIEATSSTFPGIAAQLAAQMCELAKRRKQWDIVAAHAAHAFFDRPSDGTFKDLLKAAKRAGCQELVGTLAQQFLETGVSPLPMTASGKANRDRIGNSSWPLPVPEYLNSLHSTARRASAPEPYFNVLLDIAIADKRPDEVLHWYDEMARCAKPNGFGYLNRRGNAERVAQAIVSAYPERALAIYRGMLDEQLPHAETTAYENCVTYLRHMRAIYMQLDREDYWTELVADIRFRYRNRPRFQEMLERLSGRTIVQALKSARR